jgi:hypothetical protein
MTRIMLTTSGVATMYMRRGSPCPGNHDWWGADILLDALQSLLSFIGPFEESATVEELEEGETPLS